MAEKKQSRAVYQRQNSASGKRRGGKGKPFPKGNEHAFKPGQSGNPAGRPKCVTVSEAYRLALAQPFPDDPAGRTCAEVIADKIVQAATAGNLKCVREITDRVEGRPAQTVKVDATVRDWRALAQANGLSETDVLLEASRIIESDTAASHAESD